MDNVLLSILFVVLAVMFISAIFDIAAEKTNLSEKEVEDFVNNINNFEVQNGASTTCPIVEKSKEKKE